MNQHSLIAIAAITAVALWGCGDGGDGQTGAGGSIVGTTSANSAALACYNTLQPALDACQTTDQSCIGSCTDGICDMGCTTTLCSCMDQAFGNAQTCAASAKAPGDGAFWGCERTCFQSFCACDEACTTTTCPSDCESTLEACESACVKPTPYP